MEERAFIADVKRELSLRKWNYADLANATGYSHGTIKLFMSECYKCDVSKIKSAIITALFKNQKED